MGAVSATEIVNAKKRRVGLKNVTERDAGIEMPCWKHPGRMQSEDQL